MSDLVGNPEDRFSRVEAHTIVHMSRENLLSGFSSRFRSLVFFIVEIEINYVYKC